MESMSRRERHDNLMRELGVRPDGLNNAIEANSHVLKQNYVIMYTELAMGRFRYNNLPDTVPERIIDWVLCRGSALGWMEALLVNAGSTPTVGLVAGRATYSGVDFYGNPTQGSIYGESGDFSQFATGSPQYDKDVQSYSAGAGDLVIGWDTVSRVSTTQLLINQYVDAIVDAHNSINSLLVHMKRPVIITGPIEMRQTLANVYRNWISGQPAFVGVKGGSLEEIEIKELVMTPPGTADLLDKAWDSLHQYQQELNKVLGIESVDSTKRERLITDEVSLRNTEVRLHLDRYRIARELMLDQVNKRFGTNMELEVAVTNDSAQVDDPALTLERSGSDE